MSRGVERRRLKRLRATRIRWKRRVEQATSEAQLRYAEARVRALSPHRIGSLDRRVERCGWVGHDVECACPDPNGGKLRSVLWRGCRQWWVCVPCRKRRQHRLDRRLTESITVQYTEATAGGFRQRLRMLTLTGRHTGDVVRDRRALAEAWRRFYKLVRKWLGAYPYAGVWELTAGEDRLGHPHMHIVVVWPRFVPYGRVRTLWLRAAHGCSTRINVATMTRGPEGAAHYLGKYLSKGVDASTMGEVLVGDWLAATYNQRSVFTSRRFWRTEPPVCRCCGERVRAVRSAGTRWVRDLCTSGARHGVGERAPPMLQRGVTIDDDGQLTWSDVRATPSRRIAPHAIVGDGGRD